MKDEERNMEEETGGASEEAVRSSAAGSEQPAGTGTPGPRDTQEDTQRAETPRERAARYRAMVEGEFKDLFTADTQRIIDRRFKETRTLREDLEAQRPILERVMERYGVAGFDLAALAAAMDAEEDRADQEAQRLGELLAETARVAADQRERAVVEDIRARGARPAENGAGAQNGVTARLDLTRMTRQERADIAKRAMRGEKITFC